MFADDNSIENIQQLFFDFKKYLKLQKKYTQLEVAEKLTILLSTLILVLLVVILAWWLCSISPSPWPIY